MKGFLTWVRLSVSLEIRHIPIQRCWIVGFRYVYFDECVIEKQTFLGKLKDSYSLTAQPGEIRRNPQKGKRPIKYPYQKPQAIRRRGNTQKHAEIPKQKHPKQKHLREPYLYF